MSAAPIGIEGWTLTSQGYVRGTWRIYAETRRWFAAWRSDVEHRMPRFFESPEAAVTFLTSAGDAETEDEAVEVMTLRQQRTLDLLEEALAAKRRLDTSADTEKASALGDALDARRRWLAAVDEEIAATEVWCFMWEAARAASPREREIAALKALGSSSATPGSV